MNDLSRRLIMDVNEREKIYLLHKFHAVVNVNPASIDLYSHGFQALHATSALILKHLLMFLLVLDVANLHAGK